MEFRLVVLRSSVGSTEVTKHMAVNTQRWRHTGVSSVSRITSVAVTEAGNTTKKTCFGVIVPLVNSNSLNCRSDRRAAFPPGRPDLRSRSYASRYKACAWSSRLAVQNRRPATRCTAMCPVASGAGHRSTWFISLVLRAAARVGSAAEALKVLASPVLGRLPDQAALFQMRRKGVRDCRPNALKSGGRFKRRFLQRRPFRTAVWAAVFIPRRSTIKQK